MPTYCLTELRRISVVLERLQDSLLLLEAKRATLEEKILARLFHEWAAEYALLLHYAHRSLAKHPTPLPEDILNQLSSVNGQVEETVEQFLKMLRYDPNFFEQYYEHNLVSRLTYDCCYQPELASLVSQVRVFAGAQQ